MQYPRFVRLYVFIVRIINLLCVFACLALFKPPNYCLLPHLDTEEDFLSSKALSSIVRCEEIVAFSFNYS